MNITLAGKRALVTGGNSGIGAAIANALAQAGAKVAVNYLVNPELAERMVAAIRGMKGEALSLLADVSDGAAVAKMFAAIDREWGGIDILVNSAGIDGPRAF